MNTNLPNLYDAFGLDRSESSEALGISLSARDLRLEQMGISQEDPRRTQTVQAFAVLADPAKRATYDAQIDAGTPLTWAQIQHLGNFGTLSNSAPPQQPQPQPSQQWNSGQTYAFGDPTMDYQPQQNYDPMQHQVNSSMYGQQPFASAPAHMYNSNQVFNRPPSSTRLWMAVLDMFFASVAGSIVAGIFSFGSETLFGIIMFLFTIVYIVGSETVFGSTPAKKIMGYETRDVDTQSKLSAGASVKRNWWKLIGFTGIGFVVSLVMAAIYGSSINENNQMRGSHDRLANAEVVKKNS
ncbi:hypothetical protein N24_0813 [Corynebacterium suranareeae]|uniref:RDD domain-containing protein n=1 Tax=Corynebacterium suranareeae TaxID=2506452 RepID=A0A160PP17_9CORY|nr:RDD family protein [Corynebacterium suranareeae]BAU95075.1 hypothetical protein N24_0813 [Corynebacterium suranareeae]